MSNKNKNLHKAKKEKNDEFYTRLEDIEKELAWYKDKLQGKIVYCNCDDYRWSNFPKYFKMNFETLGLKKLIATNYDTGDGAWRYEYDGQEEKIKPLLGNGDFRTDECKEILKESDLVCTNPPFSLFREYIAQLFQYNKKFIIIGNKNAISYKEVFPKIKDNKLWLGASIKSGDREFRIPSDWETHSSSLRVDDNGNKYLRIPGVCWFTNVDYEQRHDKLELFKKYDAADYPTYDNYNAIEVSKTEDIPEDYYGVMGVPITFLFKYCPEQFEIVKFRKGNDDKDLSVSGVCPYFRILIKRKS